MTSASAAQAIQAAMDTTGTSANFVAIPEYAQIQTRPKATSRRWMIAVEASTTPIASQTIAQVSSDNPQRFQRQ